MNEKMLHVAVVTVNRSDFGRLLPVCRELERADDARVSLYVSGNHFDERFGLSVTEIQDSNIAIAGSVDAGNPLDCTAAAGGILAGIGKLLARDEPDCVVILGDRYEMLAAAQAALLENVPIAHIGGGYLTRGAIDEQIRNAITELADRHFVANETCAARLTGMGVAKEKIFVTGAPDIDALKSVRAVARNEFLNLMGMNPDVPFVLVTIHPETHLEYGRQMECLQNVERVLMETEYGLLITAPSSDKYADEILSMTDRLSSGRENAVFNPSLGHARFVNAMRHAAAMFGNSSGGIIESASVPVPAVNIGRRQEGREKAGNVLDCGYDRDDMARALQRACSDEFRRGIADVRNPYGDGQAAKRIAGILVRDSIRYRPCHERGVAPFGSTGRGRHGPGKADYSQNANNPG